jgi:tRNA-Thr(GGU) m(6)t(6)A37 methyltransferase TsaA
MPADSLSIDTSTGFIELFEEYANELMDIESFSHLILIYHFHRLHDARGPINILPEEVTHGIFATRSPARPNAIGLSTVHLIAIIDNRLFVEGLDMLDKTPLIDIKPFWERYDNRFDTRAGDCSFSIT